MKKKQKRKKAQKKANSLYMTDTAVEQCLARAFCHLEELLPGCPSPVKARRKLIQCLALLEGDLFIRSLCGDHG